MVGHVTKYLKHKLELQEPQSSAFPVTSDREKAKNFVGDNSMRLQPDKD